MIAPPTKVKLTTAELAQYVRLLAVNQNAIIAELRGGSKTAEEAEAISKLFEDQPLGGEAGE